MEDALTLLKMPKSECADMWIRLPKKQVAEIMVQHGRFGRSFGALPRAEEFGDLIAPDHKILNEGCESRDNHRYAVVVQDLATQWIQSYPCKTETFQKTEKSLQKFSVTTWKPKVMYKSTEFGKVCEDLSWNHCRSTPHSSDTKWDCWESSAQS